jgi:hypothetical protein
MIAKEILLMEPIRLNRYNTVVPPQKKDIYKEQSRHSQATHRKKRHLEICKISEPPRWSQ